MLKAAILLDISPAIIKIVDMFSTPKDLFQNLKVFPLPSWVKSYPWGWNADYKIIMGGEVPDDKCLGRHGLYIDQKTKTCWIESPHGAHYYPKYEHYLLELDAVFHKPLTDRALAALKVLESEGLLSAAQRASLYQERQLRGVFVAKRATKRLLKFCLQRGIAPPKIKPLPLP